MQRQLLRLMMMCWISAAVAQAQVPSPAGVAPRVFQFSSATGGSYLGIGVQDVEAGRLRELKLKEERGVEVTAVEEDSPAAKAGVRKGDVVLEMNGQRVEGVEQFVRMVRETPVGRETKLLVSRAGDLQTLTAKVAQRKSWTVTVPATPMGGSRLPMPDMPSARMSWRNGSLGVEAESLKDGLAEFFGVKQGVLVRAVSKGSPAEKSGLKAGDVIVKVNDRAVGSPSEVGAVLRERGERKTVNLLIVREKKEVPMTVTFEDEHGSAIGPRVRTVARMQDEPFF